MERTAQSIVRALDTGIPFLKLGNDENPIVLAKRRRGEVIDDPDCERGYEALEDGLFRRFRSEKNGVQGWTWLRLCHAEVRDIVSFLGDEITQLPPVDRDTMGMDAAWQAMQWKEASQRNAAREASVAKRTLATAAVACATLVYGKGNEQISADAVPDMLRKAAGKTADEGLKQAAATAAHFIEQGDWDKARARMDEFLDARVIAWTPPERDVGRGMAMGGR